LPSPASRLCCRQKRCQAPRVMFANASTVKRLTLRRGCVSPLKASMNVVQTQLNCSQGVHRSQQRRRSRDHMATYSRPSDTPCKNVTWGGQWRCELSMRKTLITTLIP
jgi:hypothetical protein